MLNNIICPPLPWKIIKFKCIFNCYNKTEHIDYENLKSNQGKYTMYIVGIQCIILLKYFGKNKIYNLFKIF